jgi:rhodanese-related sulfurtransferase
MPRHSRSSRSVQFIVENWILILAAFVSGALLVWPMVGGGMGGGALSTADAVRLLNQQKAVLIDVREPAEFAAGHAAGARNIPLAGLDGAKALPSNKALPLVVVCATGARSSRAVAQLRKAGYTQVHSLSGGNAAWRDASLPIERSA